jgi:magnesium-protoporphyrin IX monomethyl ester (oxidative) cyclase
MAAQLYIINPTPRKGRTNERAQSGGLGVSRKLKPGEKPFVEVLPHDFLYQAAVAEQAGHRAQFIDLILEHIADHTEGINFVQRVVERGKGEDPAAPIWLGVRISIPSLHSDLRMANMLKEAMPEARVYVFGNVLMTTYRHWIGEARVDYLLYGEPEAIIEELLAADDPTTVKGVISVKDYEPIEKPGLFDMASTALHRNWRQTRDISKLPRAAWHLLELGRYAPKGRVSDLAISLPASRGCFMPCTMCAYNLHEGRSMRFRTPEEVLDEMEYLHRTYGIRHIRFRDPNFSANKPHLRTIAEGMIARHLPIEASAELSLELLDRELLELMYRAGIRTILTGVESDDPSCMASIGQHVKINRILEGKLAICRELGIKVYTFFLIGSPEETWHSVRKTFTFARSLGTECTMTIMTPFPGTPIYWRALRENLLIRGQEMTYEDWNSYTATMRTYKLSLQDLKFARLWARLETYIPYTWKQLKDAPARQRLRGMTILAPRVAALGLLRVYAAWRLREEERQDPSLRSQPSGQTTAATVTAPGAASNGRGRSDGSEPAVVSSTSEPSALSSVQTGIQVTVRARNGAQPAQRSQTQDKTE